MNLNCLHFILSLNLVVFTETLFFVCARCTFARCNLSISLFQLRDFCGRQLTFHQQCTASFEKRCIQQSLTFFAHHPTKRVSSAHCTHWRMMTKKIYVPNSLCYRRCCRCCCICTLTLSLAKSRTCKIVVFFGCHRSFC